MNQSKLEVITCNWRKARENVCKRVTIGFSFWLDKKVAGNFQANRVTKLTENQLLFYTQMKTAQLCSGNFGRFGFREKIFVKEIVHRGSTQWKLFKLWSIYSLSDQATSSPSNSLILVSLHHIGNRFVPSSLVLGFSHWSSIEKWKKERENWRVVLLFCFFCLFVRSFLSSCFLFVLPPVGLLGK